MSAVTRLILGMLIATMVLVVPVVHYRWTYTHAKRLRVVTPGVLYRSGELTASGFIEAFERFKIRTIVNLQDEYPDPDLPEGYWLGASVKESSLCHDMGVKYVHIPPDLLSPQDAPYQRPAAIDHFLAVMDEPANYPVLIHCRAGLHRTGVITAVYRMEYCGWTPSQALEELKANGFGDFPCTAANDYITQYILTYKPGIRKGATVAQGR